MRTILVLAQHPELPEAIRAALNAEEYRLIHRLNLEDAEPFLAHGIADVVILDTDSFHVHGAWAVEKLRRQHPHCPLLLYTGRPPLEWEEEAYLQGVSNILGKPVRARLLNNLLQRLESRPASLPGPPVRQSERMLERASRTSPRAEPGAVRTLEVLRDFSGVLTHSLRAEALLRQFLLLLREILGVNRAAIFLRQPTTLFGQLPSPQETRRLRSACAIGLSAGLLEHFELSFESGLGGFLFRQGRILRRDSEEAQNDREMLKEFDLLGAQVAIPILDRETLVGVAVFDGRVTGEPLANGELELIFHLLEELGLAVKNIWLHDQLAANHEMMAEILRELSSACVVVSRDLVILHANKAARRFFKARGQGDIEFSDLPQFIGTRVYQVLNSGTATVPFRFEPEDGRGTIYHVSVVPFQHKEAALPNSVLLIVEDHTQNEQLRQLEVEAANLRLVKSMADRMAHEIGNALVPLSTHQQLLSDKYKDPEFRASLDSALADGVKRIARLTNQMRFLARDTPLSREAFALSELVEEAYYEAQKYHAGKPAPLKCEDGKQPFILTGDRGALKHALAEVLLNALQANTGEGKVGVRLHADTDPQGGRWVHIDVKDTGPGFAPEAARKVPMPFFTTRNVGLGLGLTVSRKIVETHHGKLDIAGPKDAPGGAVRISLPMEASAA